MKSRVPHVRPVRKQLQIEIHLLDDFTHHHVNYHHVDTSCVYVHLLPICRPSTAHLLPIYRPSAAHLLSIYRPSAAHLLPICCQSTAYLLPICRPSAANLPPICRPFAAHCMTSFAIWTSTSKRTACADPWISIRLRASFDVMACSRSERALEVYMYV